MSKKRKVSEENRVFQDKWETEYLFVNNKDNKPQCLVCLLVLSVHKEYNLNRHYTQHHAAKYKDYTGQARLTIVSDLKKKVSAQKNLFNKSTTLQKNALLASYIVSAEIAKAKKSFTDGEFVKKCCIEVAQAFGQEKFSNELKNVSLSKQTVSRRIEEISKHVSSEISNIVSESSYFSLALDESTDLTDTAQLLIFIRTIDNNFMINEELLALESLHGNTKGQDIFDALMKALNSCEGTKKLSAIVTDGAKAMVGSQVGLVGLLRKAGISCPSFHCIIHQEALCGKILEMEDTMKTVMKCVNMIKGGNRSLTHRKFMAFLTELEAEYGDLTLFTEVRWLSKGNCLKRFFALRKEVAEFLNAHINTPISKGVQEKLLDSKFLCNMAFLTDISHHMNELNLKLQGRNQTVPQLVGHLDGFVNKLKVFIASLEKANLVHFPSCKEIMEEIPTSDFSFCIPKLNMLLESFNERFLDFNELRPHLFLFNNPMTCDISQQDDALQLELCDLQSDPVFQKRPETGVEFWSRLPEDKYPKLRDFGKKIVSMFGSTYICESTFSSMKFIKSTHRNRLTDNHLQDLLKVATTSTRIDFDKLVNDCARPQCSH